MIKLVSVKLLHSLTKIDGNSNGVGTIKSAQKTCLSLTKKKDKCLNDAHFRLKKKKIKIPKYDENVSKP